MWPKLTNINDNIYNAILANQEDNIYTSELNVWMRVFSGAKNGLYIESNPNWGLLGAQNEDPKIKGSVTQPGLYGNTTNMVGSLGRDWNGNGVNVSGGQSMKPMPLITGINVKEGGDQLSRRCTINMRVHSVEQLEMVQTYFMEPGFILFLEWGWNNYDGTSKAFKLKEKDKNNIPNVPSFAGDRMLSTNLSSIRIKSVGSYDCFSGFITGGSVQSSGEFYDVTIKLSGVPALPSALQSQNLTYSEPTTTTSGGVTTGGGFTTKEITDSSNSDGQIRFRKFFNDLPSQRQTSEVKSMKPTHFEFINYDYRASGLISNWIGGQGGTQWWEIWKPNTSFQKIEEQANIDRKKVFSPNKYVRLNHLVDILNKSGELSSYKLGSTEVSIEIVSKGTPIGAFPKMFSTKPEVMVLSGKLPDFSQYFLSDRVVNSSILETEIDNSINGISFVQYKECDVAGYNEKSGYWGYLGNIFINIDVVKKYMEKNIGIREMFLGILNECSSAVNSFWDFQIVEREVTENEKKKIVLSVYDENWIGKTSSVPKQFYHSGPKSVFLDANLSIDLPASMTNKIIGQRAALSLDKDSIQLSAGPKSFFGNAGGDKFFAVGKRSTTDLNPATTQTQTLEEQLASTEAERDSITAGGEVTTTSTPGLTTIDEYSADGKLLRTTTISAGGSRTTYANSAEAKKLQELEKDLPELKKSIEEQKNANISSNIEKIDVVPNPEVRKITRGASELNYFTGTFKDSDITDATTFRTLFRIYAYKDSALLDILKNRMFNGVKGSGQLSTLLPIKYSFTILGNSGIQRGDMFNIIGLPKRYSNHGLFQVTEAEHSIQDMMWKTTITGAYRQQQ